MHRQERQGVAAVEDAQPDRAPARAGLKTRSGTTQVLADWVLLPAARAAAQPCASARTQLKASMESCREGRRPGSEPQAAREHKMQQRRQQRRRVGPTSEASTATTIRRAVAACCCSAVAPLPRSAAAAAWTRCGRRSVAPGLLARRRCTAGQAASCQAHGERPSCDSRSATVGCSSSELWARAALMVATRDVVRRVGQLRRAAKPLGSPPPLPARCGRRAIAQMPGASA